MSALAIAGDCPVCGAYLPVEGEMLPRYISEEALRRSLANALEGWLRGNYDGSEVYCLDELDVELVVQLLRSVLR